MDFPSVPVFLDPPSWQQQPDHQQVIGNENLQLPSLPPTAAHHVSSSIRPVSMADRARLAKIARPEGPLKCPRCESTNTKFCYFNNYSLSQPRHFCKTCRRYWTRGGALRSVPVGGGCRRNKKRKSSSSKSSVTAERQSGTNSSHLGSSSEIIGQMPQPSQFPFMALQNFPRLGLGDIGFNINGLQGEIEATNMGHSTGSDSGGNGAVTPAHSDVAINQRWAQRFPFLAGFEAPPGLSDSFQSEGTVEASSSVNVGFGQLLSIPSSSGVTQIAAVNMEGHPGTNLDVTRNASFWIGNSMPNSSDLGSSSASTNHFL